MYEWLGFFPSMNESAILLGLLLVYKETYLIQFAVKITIKLDILIANALKYAGITKLKE